MKETERKIKKALVQLMLNQPFFSTGLLNLDIQEDPSCPTAYVTPRGILGYNPNFVDKLTDRQVQFLLCHELLHVLFLHLIRKQDREQQRWNLACDIVIDTMLQVESFEIILPPDRGTGINAVGKTAEEVYSILEFDEREKKKTDGKEGEEREGGEEGEGEGVGKGEEGEGKGKEGEGEEEGQGSENSEGGGYKGFDEHRTSPCDAQRKEELEQKWQSVLIQAANAARQQGKLPGTLAEIIDEMLYPPVPWRVLLSQFVQRSRKTDYSWIHPNRRYITQGIYLPGYYEQFLKLVVAIDSSGSISSNELSIFIGALKNILESVKCEVTLIVCDAEIQKVRENIDIAEIQKIELKGRGGTDFRPVFKYLEKNALEVDCLLYLTDGEGDYPERAPQFPTLWCLVQECDVPFGDKIIIKKEEGIK